MRTHSAPSLHEDRNVIPSRDDGLCLSAPYTSWRASVEEADSSTVVSCECSKSSSSPESGSKRRETVDLLHDGRPCWCFLPTYPSSPRNATWPPQINFGNPGIAGDHTPLSGSDQQDEVQEQASEPPTFHQETSIGIPPPIELFRANSCAPPPNTPGHDADTYTIPKLVKTWKERSLGWVYSFWYIFYLVLSTTFLYVEDTWCRQSFAQGRAVECLLWISVHLCALGFYMWVSINPGYIRKAEEYQNGLSNRLPRTASRERALPHVPVKAGHSRITSSLAKRDLVEAASTHHTLPPETESESDGEINTAFKPENVTRECSIDHLEDRRRYPRASSARASSITLSTDNRATQAARNSCCISADTSCGASEPPRNLDASAEPRVHPTRTEGCLLFNGRRYTFCKCCRLLQPLRARHCKECNHCVLTFDHHCTFLGCCIGEFNHWRFYFFLVTQTAALVWDSAAAWSGLRGRFRASDWIIRNSCTLLVWIVTTFAAIGLAGLLVYHTYLILSSQTTWEHMHRQHIGYLKDLPKGVLPFSRGHGFRGLLENAKSFFARRGPPATDWILSWNQGDEIPFNVFENEYYDCGC